MKSINVGGRSKCSTFKLGERRFEGFYKGRSTTLWPAGNARCSRSCPSPPRPLLTHERGPQGLPRQANLISTTSTLVTPPTASETTGVLRLDGAALRISLGCEGVPRPRQSWPGSRRSCEGRGQSRRYSDEIISFATTRGGSSTALRFTMYSA
ncbi:hypothetical protein K437DRAFT_144037 [Tilletiaria anomala UBC 951]|uniref:Uncharacterized protein n=1 Tax=Tilletiaria anomala (strain ATCC 24038 / CBS 436.72 / UBC 951) TaxID=1037660 RepID=A0A066VR82_TILAU|nr:uncharacterized protein K437DRAFT_144037 [Tilletiaria anomala UBC 951]KDN43966.1 hypothetical protein K437DRAFT_144037 [Tilletiaria anomala UBC 951]